MNQEIPNDPMGWLRLFRRRIISFLLVCVLGLGTIGLIVSFIRQFNTGKFEISFNLAYYIAAYAALLTLYFARRVPDEWRAWGFLTIIYVFSVFAFFSGWLVSSGRVFLLPFIILATILVGVRAGILAAVLSFLTMVLFGLAYNLGWVTLRELPSPLDAGPIIVETIGFGMAIGMVSLALWFFQRGLEASTRAVQDAQEARAQLAEWTHDLDAANHLLAERKNRLEAANQALELQMWQASGQSQLDDILRGQHNLPQLANNVIKHLCRFLEIPVGAVYTVEESTLWLVGRYAYPINAGLPDHFGFGEGLVGQAARDQRMIAIHEIPSGSLTINSGLGETSPDNIVAWPLVYDDQVLGVIELGILGDFTNRQMSFLQSVADNIAIAFHTTQARTRIDALLAETQKQAEALQAQEEELRAANEELQEQAEVLRASQFRSTKPHQDPLISLEP